MLTKKYGIKLWWCFVIINSCKTKKFIWNVVNIVTEFWRWNMSTSYLCTERTYTKINDHYRLICYLIRESKYRESWNVLIFMSNLISHKRWAVFLEGLLPIYIHLCQRDAINQKEEITHVNNFRYVFVSLAKTKSHTEHFEFIAFRRDIFRVIDFICHLFTAIAWY